MAKTTRHAVRADGTAQLPDGLVDYAEIGAAQEIDPALEARLDALMKGPEVFKAKYKLEVTFSEERSHFKAFAGAVSVFTNGGFAHGGGDESIYFCPNVIDSVACFQPLEHKWISKKFAICPKCRSALKPRELTQVIFARLTMQNWAVQILDTFKRLDHDADIRLGFFGRRGVDLMQATHDELDRSRHGDLMNKVRLERNWAIYPLANIIKDTEAGADLSGRIRAFLAS